MNALAIAPLSRTLSRAVPRVGERVLLAAVALGLVLRLAVGWDTSLWIDETYTAVIASEPDAAGLFDWLRHELSGPVYYTLAWVSAHVTGLSNGGLRAASYILAVGSVLFVLLHGHPDRQVRLTWAALFALWWPGVLFAAQARPQALLIFLAVLQARAFLGVWKDGAPRWAWLWTISTSLMILTHLYAVVPGGLQFLALAWSQRRQLLRYLPAMVAFAPMLGWYAAQAQYYAAFATAGRKFYPEFDLGDAMAFAPHLFGGTPAIAWMTAGLAAAIAVLVLQQRLADREGPLRLSPEATLAATGVAAAALIFIVGMLRDSYIDRYLVPCAPSALLGVALAIRRAPENWRRATGAIIPMGIAQSLLLAGTTLPPYFQHDAYPAEFEQASAWLMEGGGRRPVIFTWDSPATTINSDRDLEQIGGFFFDRAGEPRPVIVGRPPAGAAGAIPLALLALENRADIIWFGDGRIPRALFGIELLDCRMFHRKKFTQVIACRNRGDLPSELTHR